MDHIVTVQDAVTAFESWMEPTDAELDAIDAEMPVIRAEMELLDAQIVVVDRTPCDLDERRIRRACRRMLAAHRDHLNGLSGETGGAA
ncbi:DUF6284 family protein [Streptomyces nigra]|uniref:DUF6284 family protein n=1 Tax=Streptomyces nigra TaxID=1827580 RepID=UPI000D5292B8|nr:DUF6284 family protein [Streptomyces nigra]AWE51184.1 hypothetical protein DC008_16735 [Streptomyces nigra]